MVRERLGAYAFGVVAEESSALGQIRPLLPAVGVEDAMAARLLVEGRDLPLVPHDMFGPEDCDAAPDAGVVAEGGDPREVERLLARAPRLLLLRRLLPFAGPFLLGFVLVVLVLVLALDVLVLFTT